MLEAVRLRSKESLYLLVCYARYCQVCDTEQRNSSHCSIRDAVTIANDAAASLSQKVALFGASAVMTPQDRERLDGLLAAVEAQQGPREAVSLPAAAAADRPVEVATSEAPFVLNGHQRSSHHGSNGSRSPS